MAYAPHRRLYLCLAASVVLHALLLGSFNLAAMLLQQPVRTLTPVLQAHLLPTVGAADLLKNTLSDAHGKILVQPPPPAVRPDTLTRLASKQTSPERKLAEHVFYPPEAVAREQQGEVRLLLVLDEQGRMTDVRIASSSGHDLLDKAAIDAAHAMGRLPGAGVREMILPVIFKLQ